MIRERIEKNINGRNGITLIALVVTIVVLLILAGITMSLIFSRDGIINRAQEADEQQMIAAVRERLEVAKGTAFIDGKGYIIPERYFEIIEEEGIINNKDENVLELREAKYEVVTKDGYIFIITLIPQPDTIQDPVQDIEIEYDRKSDESNVKLNVEDVTSRSVNVGIEGSNFGNGPYIYAYKKTTDENWTEITSDETTYMIDGLEENTEYDIAVRVNISGTTIEDSTTITTRNLIEGTIEFGEPMWENGLASVVLTLNTQTENKIQYQIKDKSTDWIDINDGDTISGLELGDTVVAIITDGVNMTDPATTTIEDKISPTLEISKSNVTYNSVTINATAVDGQSGIASYEYYRNDELIQTIETSDMTSSYTFSSLTEGTSYTFKVIVKDRANNQMDAELEVGTENAIASIGSVIYYSLSAAVDAVPSNGTQTTIELLKDTTETVTIPNGKNIILNMNNHTVSQTGHAIINYGTIQINNGSISTTSENGNAVRNFESGNITLNGLTITSDMSAVSNYANMTITGNTKIKSNSTNVVPVVCMGGTINITGATITDNATAIYNDTNGTVNISGNSTNISGNGNALAISNLGTMGITGGSITSTGGNPVQNTGKMTISGNAQITSSTTMAAVVNYSDMDITGGTINSTSNAIVNFESSTLDILGTAKISSTATNNVAISNYGTVTMSAGSITSSSNYGILNQEGATANISGTAQISGAISIGNYGILNASGGTVSTTLGDAAINEATGTMTISGSAKFQGTAQYSTVGNHGTLNINGGTITASQSECILNYENAKLTVTGGTIQTTGADNGAIINNASGTIDLKGTSTKILSSNVSVVNNGTTTISENPTITATGVAIENGKSNASANLSLTGGSISATQGDAILNFATMTIGGSAKVTGNTDYITIGNQTGATLNITGGTITVTSAKSTGLVNQSGATLNMSGGNFTSSITIPVNNSAGGIFNISGGTISTNDTHAVSNSGTMQVSGSASISNASTQYPTLYNYSALTINGGTIKNNSGGYSVYNSGGSVNYSSGTVSSPYQY